MRSITINNVFANKYCENDKLLLFNNFQKWYFAVVERNTYAARAVGECGIDSSLSTTLKARFAH